MNCLRAVLPYLSPGGSIVNAGSGLSLQGRWNCQQSKTRQLNTQWSFRYTMAGHQEPRFGDDLEPSPVDANRFRRPGLTIFGLRAAGLVRSTPISCREKREWDSPILRGSRLSSCQFLFSQKARNYPGAADRLLPEFAIEG